MNIKNAILYLLFVAFTYPSQGQNWKLDASSPPQFFVTGTSTLHDWKVTCDGVLELTAQLNLSEQSADIPSFSFNIPVDKMEGGRGATMNNKIKEAFKSSEHPHISYRQQEPATISHEADGVIKFISRGTLSMAGVEKTVTVQSTGALLNDRLIIKGTYELKMSDFGIEPPTAMFGQIKTNDDVVVHFELFYTN